ncbi:NAD(P)-binding protein [Nocardia sp. NPDC048505]|uniref:NAD(P)-binding protein n=1 Tax=unclassified Nocardia TaxID=2637762 RepID=UPI0033F58AC0
MSRSMARASPRCAATTSSGSTPGTLRDIAGNLSPRSRHLSSENNPRRGIFVKSELQIIGAGLTGLTAAIMAAQLGWQVSLEEAHAQPGGRARTLGAPYRANQGPHAVYIDGAFWAWLAANRLTPPIVAAPPRPSLIHAAGRLTPWPVSLHRAIHALPSEAPVDRPFREWLIQHVDAEWAEAIIGVAFVFTFDHDPGRLSAAFVRQGLSRSMAGGARYVVGGWSKLVDLLTDRARDLDIRLRTGSRITALPAGPTILATSLASARQLTGDQALTWPSSRVATFDLGLRAPKAPNWFRVLDLDARIYAARYSLADPLLAPPAHELVQISAACFPGEGKTQVQNRVGRLLDCAWPGWRDTVAWRRGVIRANCTGALDLPGTTWRDRPAIDRGNGVFVVTDQSAAPGLLAEVGINAAERAVAQLGATRSPEFAI